MSLLKIEHQISLFPKYLEYRTQWLIDYKMHYTKVMYEFLELGIMSQRDQIDQEMLISLRKKFIPDYGEWLHDRLMTFEEWYGAITYTPRVSDSITAMEWALKSLKQHEKQAKK